MDTEHEIWCDWLHTLDIIDKQDQELFEQWIITCCNNKEKLAETWHKLVTNCDDSYTECGIKLETKMWKKLFVGGVEIFRPILPLGSVVDLKKDMLAVNNASFQNVENIRIVITNRFLSYTNHGYFTYAGVVYPIGVIQSSDVIHFSESLIDEVVSKGYEDEMEHAFIMAMKRENILNRDMNSYDFSSEEEHKKLAEHMEKKNVR